MVGRRGTGVFLYQALVLMATQATISVHGSSCRGAAWSSLLALRHSVSAHTGGALGMCPDATNLRLRGGLLIFKDAGGVSRLDAMC